MFDSDWESAKDTEIQIFGLVEDSIVDGPEIRFSIFVQGCSHKCPGCHNPESQPATGGTTYTLSEIREKATSNKLVSAITFTGGEPFEQCGPCAILAKKLKEDGYNIWAYSGYIAEDLIKRAESDEATRIFLENIDVLVDGPYIQDLGSYELKWRGSSNQRIIDMQKTLNEGRICQWQPPTFEVPLPPSW